MWDIRGILYSKYQLSRVWIVYLGSRVLGMAKGLGCGLKRSGVCVVGSTGYWVWGIGCGEEVQMHGSWGRGHGLQGLGYRVLGMGSRLWGIGSGV